MNSRPVRPGSSQALDFDTQFGQFRQRVASPIRNERNITSPFGDRVMSPGPSANPIALQLRGSQANLQQALRMHEDISRQVFYSAKSTF